MAGGILNIISEGNNNVILTGDPSKTFFKATYSKYTNFGLQKFRIDFDGQRVLRLTEPSQFNFKIPRNGDLLMDTYIVVTLPHIWSPIYHPCAQTGNKWASYDFRWIKNLGAQMVKEIEIRCGNFTLQKYSGDYLACMVERDFDYNKKQLFYAMTGNVTDLHDPANSLGRSNTYPSAYYTNNPLGAEPSIRSRTLYIPLNTWFCMDSKCAFPLASMQYNDLTVSITMRPIEELYQIRDVFDPNNMYPYMKPDFTRPEHQFYRFLQTPPAVNLDPVNYENRAVIWNADVHLMATYAFLGKDELRTFVGQEQIYLIKEIVTYNFENVTGARKLKIPSTGLVANWMWHLQRNDVYMRNEWSNYSNWPYRVPPANIAPVPVIGLDPTIVSDTLDNFGNTIPIGPFINPNGSVTSYFYTQDYATVNQKEIMESMGILLNGEYRENLLTREIFDFVEKYTRTGGYAGEGVYCYNFCLNSNMREYQPSGAINMSKFKTIEFEINTYVPQIDSQNSFYDITCNGDGQIIGTNISTWRLYEYNFNMTVYEERYNVLSFIGGYAGLMYAK
jgi:hypothetical protein